MTRCGRCRVAVHGDVPLLPRRANLPKASPPSDVLSPAGDSRAVLPDSASRSSGRRTRRNRFGSDAEFTAALDVLRGLGARIDTLKLPVSFDSMAVIVGKIIAARVTLHREWIDRTDHPRLSMPMSRIASGGQRSTYEATADYVKDHGRTQTWAGHSDVRRRATSMAYCCRHRRSLRLPLTAIDQGKAPMTG